MKNLTSKTTENQVTDTYYSYMIKGLTLGFVGLGFMLACWSATEGIEAFTMLVDTIISIVKNIIVYLVKW